VVKKSALISTTVLVVLSVVSLIFTSCQSQATTTQPTAVSGVTPVATVGPAKVLVFSKTGGFRHASIKDGIVAIRMLAAQHHVVADFTEDATLFTDANLAQYKAVVFLLTSGNILDDNQKAAFERYIRAGGGYAGVHSASDTEYSWTWYGQLVGAYFRSHPSVRQATIDVVDNTHPSTAMLPKQWVRTDEWYNFRTNPRASVHVLLTLDETTYQGGTMGADHPIAWYHQYDGGRAWYTALGHTSESYSEPLFLAHLWGGIAYAAGSGVQ
jgi:type 1 glutamine amidotransferase